MTKRSKLWLTGTIALILAAAIAWYVGSPRWTLSRMKTAAEAGDTDTFASYIDFPAVRASLKDEMKAKAAAEMGKPGEGMEKLGAMLAMSMVDNMVDGLVTPAMLRKAFVANKAKAGEGLAAIDAAAPDMVFDRTGFSRFRLHDRKMKDGSGLIFQRDGLAWKLIGLRLPD